MLFDFDGTMYRFEDVYTHVWRDLYDEEQQAFGHIDFHDFYSRVGEIFTSLPDGMDSDEEHAHIFGEIKRIWPGVRAGNEQLIEDYRRRSLEYMVPRPGLDDLLVRLDEAGVPWGIVSNHDAKNRGKLAAMGLSSKPATFMLSVEVGAWKPDSEIFDMALAEIGAVDRSRGVMVGDNPIADIQGGRSAGLRTVLMTDSPFATTQDGADMTISHFDDLRKAWFGE